MLPGALVWGRARRGGGGARSPLSACEPGSVTSVIPLFGVLVVLLFFVEQEGELDFLFLQVGAEARLVPRCGFHLEIFPETSPKAPHNFFPSFLPH